MVNCHDEATWDMSWDEQFKVGNILGCRQEDGARRFTSQGTNRFLGCCVGTTESKCLHFRKSK